MKLILDYFRTSVWTIISFILVIFLILIPLASFLSYSFFTVDGLDINHEFSFSHIHAELDSGKNIPRIPPSTYQYSLEGVSGNMMWLCRLRHAGKQNDIAINELATDSYTQVDVEVSWIPTQLEGFTFSLIARNIGDEEIRNHTSYLKDRLSEPGRNINLTVQYGF